MKKTVDARKRITSGSKMKFTKSSFLCQRRQSMTFHSRCVYRENQSPRPHKKLIHFSHLIETETTNKKTCFFFHCSNGSNICSTLFRLDIILFKCHSLWYESRLYHKLSMSVQYMIKVTISSIIENRFVEHSSIKSIPKSDSIVCIHTTK